MTTRLQSALKRSVDWRLAMPETPDDAVPPRVGGRRKHFKAASAAHEEPRGWGDRDAAPESDDSTSSADRSRDSKSRSKSKSSSNSRSDTESNAPAARPGRQDPYAGFVVLEGVHPAALTDEKLMKSCTFNAGRGSGPGGQHRNKVSTAVLLVHEPSGLEGAAAERRKQFDNRRMAIWRLRIRLAIKARTRVHWRDHRPSELWQSRRQGTQLSVNPKHRDYPALLAEALDVIFARRFDVAGAAGVLGVSISQLAKLLGHEKHAFVVVNEGRERQGLAPLKARR